MSSSAFGSQNSVFIPNNEKHMNRLTHWSNVLSKNVDSAYTILIKLEYKYCDYFFQL